MQAKISAAREVAALAMLPGDGRTNPVVARFPILSKTDRTCLFTTAEEVKSFADIF